MSALCIAIMKRNKTEELFEAGHQILRNIINLTSSGIGIGTPGRIIGMD